jgi:hypothetical protein
MSDEFDDVADKTPAGSGFEAKSLSRLPDGDYRLQVSGAKFEETKKGHRIFKIEVEVIDGNHAGQKCDWPHFLSSPEKGINETGIGILKKDLSTLGFDQENWTKENKRPLSGELPKVATAIVGVRFKGKKTSKDKNANLYVNERDTSDGKPAKFGPAELNAADKKDKPFDV